MSEPEDGEATGWTVYEKREDGSWVRCTTAHIFKANVDAHKLKDELALRWPEKLFAVRKY